MSERQLVTIELQGQKYPVRTTLEPDYVRRLAAYVDRKMADVASGLASTDTVRIAVLVALNLADEVFRAREAVSTPDDSRAVLDAWDAQARALDAMLETVLNAARPSD